MAKIEWNQVKMSDIQQNILAGGAEKPSKPLSMMQCLVQVVKNNISLKLLTTIGIGNATSVMNSVRQDPLLKPQDGTVVIRPYGFPIEEAALNA